MSPTRVFITTVVAALLTSTSFAKQKDEEASALIERARQASDIRRDGDAPFRLKATFRVIGDDGSKVEGTYTEFWNSSEQWRKEIVQGDFRRTIVGEGRKVWTLDDGPSPPEWIDKLVRLWEPLKLRTVEWKPAKLLDRNPVGVASRCFNTSEGEGLCFDKASGTLVQKTVSLVIHDKELVDWSCLYRDYRRFGDRDIATLYQCGQKHPQVEAAISNLAFRPELDPALFTPPANAKESRSCVGPMHPPKVIRQTEPDSPGKGDGTVAMSTIIGVDGRAHDIKVTRSVDNDYDHAAVEALRKWQFIPAWCDGEPREVLISVEMVSHVQ